MARRNGDWVAFAKRVRAALEASPEDQPEITLSLEEIKAESGTIMTLDALGSANLWRYCREGRRDFDTLTRRGLSLEERIGPDGRVVAVTFRLAHEAVVA